MRLRDKKLIKKPKRFRSPENEISSRSSSPQVTKPNSQENQVFFWIVIFY